MKRLALFALLLLCLSTTMTAQQMKPHNAGGTAALTVNLSSVPSGITVEPMSFTVQDVDGNWHTLSDYMGKVVYLEFGGLW